MEPTPAVRAESLLRTPPRSSAAARKKLRVLCVLPGVPLPTNTGGLMRSLTQLRALDAHFELTVVALHRPPQDARALRAELRGRVCIVPFSANGAEAMVSELGALGAGRPLFYARYAPRSLANALTAELRSRAYDVVHFDHLHTAQLAPLVRKLQPSARMVLDAHNVEAQIVERMAPLASRHLRLALRWQGQRLRKMEARLVREVDAVLACSHLDAAQFHAMGARCVEVVPNAATVDAPLELGRTTGRDVVFVGSFDWWPNVDAATLLAREIWPRCQARLRGARLLIVGRDPPASVQALASDRIVVTGRVESVAPYLAAARVAAVPLRAGSGTRLKIIEAWAYGLPVVSTALGAEGLPLRDGENGLLADRPDHFAHALTRVFEDPTLAAQLSSGALRAAQEFHPARIGARLAAFYSERLAPEVLSAGA